MPMPTSASSVARCILAALPSVHLKIKQHRYWTAGKPDSESDSSDTCASGLSFTTDMLSSPLLGLHRSMLLLFVSFGKLGSLDSDDDSLLCLTELAELEEVINAVALGCTLEEGRV
jgi:hypothetical protein